jgi:RNA polymerase sigma-70 factor (ECF subfamily)
MQRSADKALINGILKKDNQAILRFVQTYQDQVYWQAHRMLRSSQDTEEACQDVFMKALGRMEKFEGRCSLSTWLYKITYTTCLDVIKLRKKTAGEEEIDQASVPEWSEIENSLAMLEMNEQRGIIDRCIGMLDATDALLIDLFHLKEMAINEIVEITEMTDGAIRVRLMRARKKLAVLLERSLPAETIKTHRNERRRNTQEH